jgi:hypothetical protein
MSGIVQQKRRRLVGVSVLISSWIGEVGRPCRHMRNRIYGELSITVIMSDIFSGTVRRL